MILPAICLCALLTASYQMRPVTCSRMFPTWRSADIVQTACQMQKEYNETGKVPKPVKDKKSVELCGWFQKGKSGCKSNNPCCDIMFFSSCKHRPESSWVGRPRIVNGSNARKYKFPSIARQFKVLRCGASILNEEWLVTAAHCIQDPSLSPQYQAYTLGEYRTHHDEGPEQNVTAVKHFLHPQYKSSCSSSSSKTTVENDIALIKFEPKITFTDKIAPAMLPQPGFFQLGAAIAVGWGKSYNTAEAGILQETLLPIIPEERCKTLDNGTVVTDRHICVNYMEGGTSVCQGDSGGPLYQCLDDRLVTVGVASWVTTAGCAAANAPAAFTRISKYVDWMKEIINSE